MNIKLIRNEGCHIWQTAEKALKEALKQAELPEEFDVMVVKDDGEAKKYRFFGSPQVTIDGRDLDPSAEKATQFQVEGCRFYMWPPARRASGSESKMYEYPPKAMILEALKKR